VSEAPERKRLTLFERYLSVWVALCIVAGVGVGAASPGLVGALSRLEVSHVNLPIAVLIWLMIYPMMLRIDFAALRGVGQRPKGLLIVLFVNWLVKPFSMAALGWLFFKHLFAGIVGPELGDQYLARHHPGAALYRHGVRVSHRLTPRRRSRWL
jgi:ACR3 family arsenite transporter